MNLEEKKRASAVHLAEHRAQVGTIHETNPAELTPELVAFCAELSSDPPLVVPVVDDPHGLYGWCVDGVQSKVAAEGGRPVFGWCVWEWPGVMWNAEFHCVWESPSGELLDITPKPQFESEIVFAPDRSRGPDFNFDLRPGNRRHRIRPDVDVAAVAAGLIAQMGDGQRRYEERRASKAGLDLTAWMERKVPADPLVGLIDDVIRACGEHETYVDEIGPAGGGTFNADARLLELMRARYFAITRLQQAV